MQAILRAILMAQTPMGKKNKTRKHHWHPLVFQAKRKSFWNKPPPLIYGCVQNSGHPKKSNSFKNIRSCEKRWFENVWNPMVFPKKSCGHFGTIPAFQICSRIFSSWEEKVPERSRRQNGWLLKTHKYMVLWQCVKTLYPWWTSK